MAPQPLSVEMSMLWVFIGIILSLVLPIVVKVIRKAASMVNRLEQRQTPVTWVQRFAAAWHQYAGIGLRYLVVLGAALILAIALVFLLDLRFYHVRDAALAGIAWESLVNKIFGQGGQPGPGGNTTVTSPRQDSAASPSVS